MIEIMQFAFILWQNIPILAVVRCIEGFPQWNPGPIQLKI